MGKHPKKNKRLPLMTPEDKTFVEGVLQSPEHHATVVENAQKSVDDFIINGPRTLPPEVRVRVNGLELTLSGGPADFAAVENKIKKTLKVSILYDIPEGPVEEGKLINLIGMAFVEALLKLCEGK